MNRKTLLDTDVPNLRFKIKDNKLKGVTLTKPLKPTKYVPPKPVPIPNLENNVHQYLYQDLIYVQNRLMKKLKKTH